ncbi:MAG: hypothetical protein TR69_WS6001000739 [candidate division WS6 bacterium OLB20]|uniref:Uncharacterized protein n=1 Tax=candidate division WS6 bacterium OLB20 TaxID=1617426 RepID=A0A136LYK4_9BACT|nr:MAG: hypothetical protein TR69_WS6001000739 [candidate division WS6 bacterium OLB20]
MNETGPLTTTPEVPDYAVASFIAGLKCRETLLGKHFGDRDYVVQAPE